MNPITQQEVKNAPQSKWLFRQLTFNWVLCGVIALAYLLPVLVLVIDMPDQPNQMWAYFLIAPLIILCVPGVATVHYLKQYRYFVKHYDVLPLVSGRLDNFGTSFWYRGAVYFSVSFTLDNGEKLTVDTSAMFASWGLLALPLDDYKQRKATFLYDEASDRLYLLGVENND